VTDPRIKKYREAAEAMKAGDFRVEIPVGAEDEIGGLGRTLQGLKHSFETGLREIRMLTEVTEKINSGLVLDEVLNHVFDSFRSIIPYDRIGFSLLEEEGKRVRARWTRSDQPVLRLDVGYSALMSESSLEEVIRTGQPRILNDLETYLRKHPRSDSTKRIVEEGMRSSLTCPLIALGKPIGFMFFSSVVPNTYQTVHVEVFRQLAGQLALIVEKSRLYNELVELNELKNKFLGIAAHDLRSPLAVVQAYLDMLLDGIVGDLSGEQLEVMKKIKKTCRGMLRLIEDLLDVSAIESGRLELRKTETDLEKYLKECYAGSQMLARAKSIDLKLELEPGLPKIFLDPERMAQVLDNLISNAIKFSNQNTSVTLGARRLKQVVEIWVADEGQGIPEEELPKLFREFGHISVRPTGGEKSTGLGLAIVKRMVEAHGGTIEVRSRVGVGSTFKFTLPTG